MEYALISYDNGVWKARGLNGFQFKYPAPDKPWAERKECRELNEIGTDGPTLDRLRGKVQLAAREMHDTDKPVLIKYLFTNDAWEFFQRLLKEHHERQS